MWRNKMFCPKCGTRLNEDENVCSKCGWSKNFLKEDLPAPNANSITESGSISNNKPIPPFKYRNTKKIAFICVAIIIGIFIIGIAVHFNSDSYKLSKAAKLVYNAEYNEAVNKLSKVYDPQAELIRNYIKVLQARDNFMDTYDTDAISNVLVNDNYDYVVEAANQFKTAVYEFNQNQNLYLMPEQLRTQFDYYNNFCEQIDLVCYSDENFEDTLYNLYYQSQNVFLNRPSRNRNDTFTLTNMQYNVDVSKASVDLLNNWLYADFSDFSNSENKFTGLSDDNCPNELLYFYNSTVDFISSCNAEIESEQAQIDEDLKEFEMDDELYLTNPDASYTSYVTYDLEEIADMSNIGNNATTFQNTYYVDMLAYCLHNE